MIEINRKSKQTYTLTLLDPIDNNRIDDEKRFRNLTSLLDYLIQNHPIDQYEIKFINYFPKIEKDLASLVIKTEILFKEYRKKAERCNWAGGST